MEAYRLVFVYPDGHVEDSFEQFMEKDKAIEYGESLLCQVQNTESVFKPGNDDDFGFKDIQNPFFMVYSVEGKKVRLVYESRR